MKYLLITLYLAFMFSVCTYAQVASNPSPNVASFMVSKNFPSALPTGVPNITVPVYNMVYQGLTVPIELNYNVNSVKPDIHPGWVGLGWSLIAGGAINRVVNDKPDDLKYFSNDAHEKMPGITNVGYYYNHGALSGSDWSTTAKIKQFTDDYKGYESSGANMNHPDFKYYFPAPFTVKDYQPDEFSFSFLGYSGTFYLNDAGGWQIRCDKHFKLESTINDNGFTKFTLTDPEGIKYIFGNSATETTQQVFIGDEQRMIPKTWYLVEILFPNNKMINFNYTTGAPLVEAAPLKEEYDSGAYPNEYYYLRLSCSVVYPVYLQSITTENHNITFKRSDANDLAYKTAPFAGEAHFYVNLNDTRNQEFNKSITATMVPYNDMDVTPDYHWYDEWLIDFLSPYVYYPISTEMNAITDIKSVKLDTITVVNKFSGATQKFSFDYINQSTERLKLASMKQSSPTSAKTSVYSFTYNSTKLPDYLSEKTDGWGYYNGKTPQLDLDNVAFQESRSPDSVYAKAEILTGVTYPTGGTTTYDYELNTSAKRYTTVADADTTTTYLIGGLRIRKITNYKSTGAVADFTSYTYNKPGSGLSSGISTNSGGLEWDGYENGPQVIPVLKRQFTEAYFTSIYPSENQNGSHIGYSFVTQHFSDGSSIVSQFSNFDTGIWHEYDDEAPVNTVNPIIHSMKISKAFLRGKLLNQKTYNSANALLSEKTIAYSPIYSGNNYVKSVNTNCFFDSFYWNSIDGSASYYTGYYKQYYVDEPDLPTDYYGQAIKIYTYSNLPVTETDKLYNNLSNPIVTTKTYTYDSTTLNMLSTVTTNSKGQTEETENLYPSNMLSWPGTIYGAMVAANDISPVIESIHKVNGTQIVLNRTSYKQPYTNLFGPDSTIVKYGVSSPVTTMRYTDYDSFGNPQTVWNKGLLPTTYIYDYTGNFLVAKIDNASKNEVLYDGFENLSEGTLGLGHTGNYYHLERGYGIMPYYANLTIPDSRSYVVSFWYHISGNQWIYKKQPYTGPAFLVPEGANAIDDVFIYPADAPITTYTYDPLAGKTSETDPRGNTTYYEYDEFQRLVNIKDQHGNIKSHYCYNYAGQVADCTVSPPPSLIPPPSPPPPDPPVGVYVRVEISDVSDELHETSIFQTGNVCIKVYSDPACTIPLIQDTNMDVTLTQIDEMDDDVDGTVIDTAYNTYTIPAGQNSYCLGLMDLYDQLDYEDESGNPLYTYFFYNYILTPGSTVYKVKPTVEL